MGEKLKGAGPAREPLSDANDGFDAVHLGIEQRAGLEPPTGTDEGTPAGTVAAERPDRGVARIAIKRFEEQHLGRATGSLAQAQTGGEDARLVDQDGVAGLDHSPEVPSEPGLDGA